MTKMDLFESTMPLSTGACAGDVENFCASVKPGEARIADCLSKQQDEEAKGNTEGKVLTPQPSSSGHFCELLAQLHEPDAVQQLTGVCPAGKTMTDDCKKELHSSESSLARASTEICL